MTPIEKAKEIVDKYGTYVQKTDFGQFPPDYNRKIKMRNAKQCGFIHVNGVLELLENCFINHEDNNEQYKFWEQVKTEMEKL